MPILDQIRQGDYEMPKNPWSSISAEAKDLVRHLLTVDTSKRITLEQALEHDFLKKKRALSEEEKANGEHAAQDEGMKKPPKRIKTNK